MPSGTEVYTFLHKHCGTLSWVCTNCFGVCNCCYYLLSAGTSSPLQCFMPCRSSSSSSLTRRCVGLCGCPPHLGPLAFKLALSSHGVRMTVAVKLGSPRNPALSEGQFTLAALSAPCVECCCWLGSLSLQFCYFCLGSGSAAVFLLI